MGGLEAPKRDEEHVSGRVREVLSLAGGHVQGSGGSGLPGPECRSGLGPRPAEGERIRNTGRFQSLGHLWSSLAAVNFKGLALEDLTCFWFSGTKTSHSTLRVLSTPYPLACLHSSPSLSKMTLESLACFSGYINLDSPCRPGSVLNYTRLASNGVLGDFGEGC